MFPPSGVYSDSYSKDMAIVRTRLQWILLIVFLIFLFAFPLLPLTSEYLLRVIIEIAILVISVQGINILTGFCGQVTIGQAAFMLVGGYVSALLTKFFGFSFWVALPCAALTAALIGILFGIPSLRVKGLYLTIFTFVAHVVIFWSLRYIPTILNQSWGAAGLSAPPPTIANFVFDSVPSFYYLTIVFAILFTLFTKNIVRSGLGRAFIAVRDNDKAAEAIGINVFRYKLIAFAICSFYAGVAGSLSAHYIGWIAVDSYNLMDAVWYLGMVIIGGLGSVLGAILGVIFILALKQGMLITLPLIYAPLEKITGQSTGSGGVLLFIFGSVVILFLIFEPRGLAHRWEIFKASYRLWPFAH